MLPPDYTHGIVNLMASLRQGLGGTPGPCAPLEQLAPSELAGARKVVLLVIDGLGHDYLLAHGGRLKPWLRGALSSVFPSSTAPAITSFMTGEAPNRHAVTGWFMYLREFGVVTTILPFRGRVGGVRLDKLGLNPAAVIGTGSLFDRIAVDGEYLIGRDLVDSAYSQVMAGNARRHGYRSLDELCETLYRLVRAHGRNYIYAYWPRLDGLAHEHGIGSAVVTEHFRQLDNRIADLIDALRGSDTLLIVTADHGFIDVTPESVTTLDQHPELRDLLLLPPCGEPRAAFCHLREGCSGRFERYVGTQLADRFELHRSADLIERGWFGPGEPHPRLAERLGDYILLGRDNHVISEQLPGESPWTMIGVHGGLSPAEMRVPLLVAEC
jgi:hypothetical protein